MTTKKIVVLSGDGIGPEQTNETVKIINWLSENTDVQFELENGYLGGAAVDATGVPLPEETLKLAHAADAVLKAPIGGPKWDALPKEKRPETGLLALRKEMDLFANLRPAVVFDELIEASTIKPDIVSDLDIMMVRELTSGLYFGEPRGVKTLPTGERYGFNTLAYTDSEIERIVRYAFEIARVRNKKLCSVNKANVLETMVLWNEVTKEVHKEYQDVELSFMYVDNAAMQLVKNPKQFDVMVMENMFGDILSDLASMLTGSLGMLPSASLGAPDASGKRLAMYEPIHGAAPDIAGQNKANPISMILSFALMLEYSFGMKEMADKVTLAVRKALAKGYRTPDIMQTGATAVGTDGMGAAILYELKTLY